MESLIRLLKALRLDVRMAWQGLVLTKIAGSVLVPRPLRWAIYRAAGVNAKTMNVFPGVTLTGSALTIGAGTFINQGCYLDVAGGRIEIGENCHLAPQTMILTATHSMDGGVASRQEHSLTTTIGHHVWLGARSTVLPGVSVGDNCVVAAGAVVVKDCEPGGMYAGVPARRIKEIAQV